MRSKVQKEMVMKEKERKEQELRALAQKARAERNVTAAPATMPISSEKSVITDDTRGDYECVREKEKDMPKETREEREERLQREKIREERRRERERERRLEAKDTAMGKKSKIIRDRDRDVSEKVGMASTGAARGVRLCMINDCSTRRKEWTLVSPQMINTMYEHLEKIMETERFKPDKGFAGSSERSGPRDRPLEFEKEAEEADPFGLDQFLTEVKKGKKTMDKIGSGGTMRASAGSSRDDTRGSGRTRIGFERGC
ncbi:hypothetical protein Q3G72_025741 [Acer saccharum]|nr:hypothetical protein Q3G72_025741 [Acer saccharum]